MKKLKILLVGVLLLLALASCAYDVEKVYKAEEQLDQIQNIYKAEDELDLSSSNNLNSYEIVSKSISYNDDDILIRYPYLKSFEDKELEGSINDIIYNDVISYVQPVEDITEGFYYDLSYEIKFCNENVLSIVYTGSEFSDESAYPIDVFFTTNIDLVNAKKLKLKDIIIDEVEFVNVFHSTLEEGIDDEMIKFAYDYILQTYDKDNLIIGINAADETYGSGRYIYSYYTENSLGISWEVPHISGDHVEIEIPLEKLTDVLLVEEINNYK